MTVRTIEVTFGITIDGTRTASAIVVFFASMPIAADHSAAGPLGTIFFGSATGGRRGMTIDLVVAFSRDDANPRLLDHRRNCLAGRSRTRDRRRIGPKRNRAHCP